MEYVDYFIDGVSSPTGNLTLGFGNVNPGNVNHYNEYGMSPIHVALQAGAVEELRQILLKGADPFKKTLSGKDPEFFLKIHQNLQTSIENRLRVACPGDGMGNTAETIEADRAKLHAYKDANQQMAGMLKEARQAALNSKLTTSASAARRVSGVSGLIPPAP